MSLRPDNPWHGVLPAGLSKINQSRHTVDTVSDALHDAAAWLIVGQQQQQQQLGAKEAPPGMAANTAAAAAAAAAHSCAGTPVMSSAPQEVHAELSRLRCEVSTLRSNVGDLCVTCSSLQEVTPCSSWCAGDG